MPKLERFLPAPLLCMSFSTAVGFYFLASSAVTLSAAVLIFSLVLLCLFRVLSSLDRESRLLHLTAVCSTAFAAGLMLGICAAGVGVRGVSLGLVTDRITAVEGVLLEDPRIIAGGKAVVSLSLRRCAAEGGIRATSKGEITIFFPQENAVRVREFGRGASVFAEGSFGMTDRLTFSADSLHIVKPAPAVEQMRTGIRLGLIKRFEGKNWGGLSLALLLGIKDNLDTNLTVLYRNAGCSYILALSGMHLAVLAALIAFFLKKPLGLKAASITGAAVICLYCFIVGPMPSLNRSLLMYLLGTAAVLGALPKKPFPVLALSFLIQIVISPAAGHSASFILSYLALAGILIISPLLYSLFAGKAPDFILQPLSVSCGAFLATAGVTAFYFGMIVPMGIITGLVLVPLTTVFMAGSLAWLVLDLFSLSVFFNTPLSLLYRLMEGTVTLAGNVPDVSAGKPSFILAFSLVLMLLIAIFEYRQRISRLKLQPFD